MAKKTKSKPKKPTLEELKKPLLSSSFIDEGFKRYKELEEISKTVEERTHYIMMTIFDLFGFKGDYYWYFSGAHDEETGVPWYGLKYNKTRLETNIYGEARPAVIILKDGSEWGLEDGIPIRWLYEDFEQELINGKKEYEQRLILKKEQEALKKEQEKQNAQNLKTSIQNKLTKEELEYLKGLNK